MTKDALSYDDVLLKPQYSDIVSRTEIEIHHLVKRDNTTHRYRILRVVLSF